MTDFLSAIPAGSLRQTAGEAWRPLRFSLMLEVFRQSRAHTHINLFLDSLPGLLPDERILLYYLHFLYQNSEATIALYARYIIGLLNDAGLPCRQITALHVDAYIRRLELDGMKPGSVNTVAAAIRSFYRALNCSGFLQHNPAAFLKKRRNSGKAVLPGHLTHSLSSGELHRLFARMREFQAPLRDIVLFHILFMTGLRAEEAVRLVWHNCVIWQENIYIDILGKGGKARRVYLPGPARTLLEQFRTTVDHAPDSPVFSSLTHPSRQISRHGLYALVKKWTGRCLGRTDISPHWFRHSCFTQLAGRGAALESIKALAGHESIETTMHYNEAAKLMKPAGMLFDNF